MLGALLPWVTAGAGFISISKNGVEGDGVITLVLGLVIALVAGLVRGRRWSAIICLVLGLLAVAVAVIDMVDVSNRVDGLKSDTPFPVSASIGIGLWITALAALAVTVGAVLALAEAHRARSTIARA